MMFVVKYVKYSGYHRDARPASPVFLGFHHISQRASVLLCFTILYTLLYSTSLQMDFTEAPVLGRRPGPGVSPGLRGIHWHWQVRLGLRVGLRRMTRTVIQLWRRCRGGSFPPGHGGVAVNARAVTDNGTDSDAAAGGGPCGPAPRPVTLSRPASRLSLVSLGPVIVSCAAGY